MPVNTHNKNLKKLWNGVKEIINIKQKSLSSPSCLKDDDKILADEKEMQIISLVISLELQRIYYKIENIKENIHTKNKNPLPKLYVFFDCDPTESNVSLHRCS